MAQLPLTETVYQHLDKHEGVFFSNEIEAKQSDNPRKTQIQSQTCIPSIVPSIPRKMERSDLYRFEGRVVSFRGR
jgi:hypothetical protein